jgi:hypothetical protein
VQVLREFDFPPLHRRHLSTSQRAALAAEIAAKLKMTPHESAAHANAVRYSSDTRKRVSEETRSRKSWADQRAAEMMNVGPTSVTAAGRIKREAPDLHAAVKRGEMTIHLSRCLPAPALVLLTVAHEFVD